MSSQPRVGIDIQGDRLALARVSGPSGQPKIESLTVVEGQCPGGADCLAGARPILAVPDDEVIFKLLRVPGSAAVHDKRLLEFELAACMLESEEDFVFSATPTGLGEQYLGQVFRRERLARLYDKIGLWPIGRYDEGTCRARAIALGRGFLAFCRQPEAELVCLVDLISAGGSVCIIRQGEIVNVGCFRANCAGCQSSEAARRLAVEVKTVVSFKLTALGKHVPPLAAPRLVLSGDAATDVVRQAFAEYFTGGVETPRCSRQALAPALGEEQTPEMFLAALGAAV